MQSLSTNQFTEFFNAVHGYDPFSWQQRLLEQVFTAGTWPSLLDLPTGTGKTAALDIAVFAQALDATLPPTEQRCPRRTVLVVDRRTIVDQAYARATMIANALQSSSNPVVQAVAERLYSLSGVPANSPLGVHVLRGGIPRDDAWTHDPSRPLIVLSTVDQVGSRLLFRGYGVSEGMRPIHAGLLSNDVLFLLDEVHLSNPFRDTLKALQSRYRNFTASQLPDRWQVVEMSATPGEEHDDAFGLTDADRAEPTLAQRLSASKPVELIRIKQGSIDALAKRITKLAVDAARDDRCVGVIVNRVDTARVVHEQISQKLEGTAVRAFLVTGRMRGFDRADLEVELRVEAGTGRQRTESRGFITVATQCLEAGADLDFDVLLTECASLDALRQRFGRLDRIGDCQGSARGAVIVREPDLKTADDPIYGSALAKTWDYLESLESVDFSVDAFPTPSPTELPLLLAPKKFAPILLPSHLDAWVQTSPQPHADPDPALWLHGPQERDLDVSVVWRADLYPDDLNSTDLPSVCARLEACPPRTAEAISVPIGAVRRWLAEEPPVEISDAGALQQVDELRSTKSRPALVWRGDQSTICNLADPDSTRMRPGDTIVVPSEYGGISKGNWDPASTEPVVDFGDRAQLEYRGQAVLRLNAKVLSLALGIESIEPPAEGDPDDPDTDDREIVHAFLDSLVEEQPEHWVADISRLLIAELQDTRKARQPRLIPVQPVTAHSRHTLYIHGKKRYQRVAEGGLDLTSDGEQSSMTGREVRLDHHLVGVGDFARLFASRLGLAPPHVAALERAGNWHDVGKADPRFQQWLHGGSAFKAEQADHLLAKSALPGYDRSRRERARERAGYPKGGRHELLSVALIQSGELETSDVDYDLVLHLVASHHGYCRPFAPWIAEQEPIDVKVEINGQRFNANTDHHLACFDSGISERFWVLVRRYGWLELAWLEAILRLADHRRSEAETLEEALGVEEMANG